MTLEQADASIDPDIWKVSFFIHNLSDQDINSVQFICGKSVSERARINVPAHRVGSSLEFKRVLLVSATKMTGEECVPIFNETERPLV